MNLHSTIDTVSGSATFKDKSFDELVINGSAKLKNVKAYSVLARGSLNFDLLTIETTLTTKGGCRGSGLTAQDCAFFGGAKLKNAKVHMINARGSFAGKIVEVTGDVTASGAFKATQMTVNGLTSVQGSAKTFDSTFGEVSCVGKEHCFHNTVLSSLMVKPGNNSLDTGFDFINWVLNLFRSAKNVVSKVYLTGNTRVNGDITFEAGTGEVHLEPGATIVGQVHGGVVIKQ